MGLSKIKIKYIRSLNEKKYRNQHHAFVAEGTKLVSELLDSCHCQLLAGLPEILHAHADWNAGEVIPATEEELKRASFLKTAPKIIGVFFQPKMDIGAIDPRQQLILVLDGVQDPGNLGTIARIADWFGIEHIVCSQDTVDIFNPKTVQATMGAIARVKTHYTELAPFLRQFPKVPVYGTFLEGDNLYSSRLSGNGFIVMGSEGKGIREGVATLVDKKIFIPNFPEGKNTSESLNVAVATAITCSEFRRRNHGIK